MPLIIARILEGRPADKVEQLIEALTAAAAETLAAPRDSVRVIVEEVPKTHWGIGGKTAKSLGR